MSTRIATRACFLAAALTVAACSPTDTPDDFDAANAGAERPAAESPGSASDAPTDSQPQGADTSPTSGPPTRVESFDAERARAAARALLGVGEAELEPSRDLRIARRGEERFPMTMDLRPGRMNVELDERDGIFVVTRVSVETPDGTMAVE